MTNMTSLIFFGTIIILLGIIIVCFYNKSFENSCDINEGFATMIDSKPFYEPYWPYRTINYNPSPASQGYVNQKLSINNKYGEYWVLYQDEKPPAPAYIPQARVNSSTRPPPCFSFETANRGEILTQRGENYKWE